MDAASIPLPMSSASSIASSASSDFRLKEAAANAIMRAKLESAAAAKVAKATAARLEREERQAAAAAAKQRKTAEREAKAAAPKRPVGRPPKAMSVVVRKAALPAPPTGGERGGITEAPVLTPPPHTAEAEATISELRARLVAMEAAYADAMRRLETIRAAVY